MQYQELINTREQKCPIIHNIRNRINEFYQMNVTFYDSLSSTQVYEFKLYFHEIHFFFLIILVY
jgi:hypothetical protein